MLVKINQKIFKEIHCWVSVQNLDKFDIKIRYAYILCLVECVEKSDVVSQDMSFL